MEFANVSVLPNSQLFQLFSATINRPSEVVALSTVQTRLSCVSNFVFSAFLFHSKACDEGERRFRKCESETGSLRVSEH